MSPDLRTHELFGDEAPSDPSRWVFHYTSLTAATSIATSRRLLLSRMAKMNDPREYKAVEPITFRAGAGGSLTDDQVRGAINSFVNHRLQIAVASFAIDAVVGPPGTATRVAGRGFARPALWAHYAYKHRGVCLIFDRAELVRRIHKKFAGAGAAQQVAYFDGIDVNDVSGMLDLDDVARRGAAAAVSRHLRSHLAQLVFTKNGDWSPEREWRCCVLEQPPGDVDIELDGNVLCGVVAGLDVSEKSLDEVRFICDQFGLRHNVAGTYLHQLNMIDVRGIDTSSPAWRYEN